VLASGCAITSHRRLRKTLPLGKNQVQELAQICGRTGPRQTLLDEPDLEAHQPDNLAPWELP